MGNKIKKPKLKSCCVKHRKKIDLLHHINLSYLFYREDARLAIAAVTVVTVVHGVSVIIITRTVAKKQWKMTQDAIWENTLR